MKARKLLSLALAAVLLLSLGSAAFADSNLGGLFGAATGKTSSDPVPDPSNPSGWTLLVYICGSDLESGSGYASSDIAEMIKGNPGEDVTVVIQTGGASEWDNNMVKAGELGRYIIDDADLTLLESLPNADMGESSTLEDFVTWGVTNYPNEHIGLILWNHGGGSVSGVCFDETESYTGLTLRAIDTALSFASAHMTDKFEFIGFDACLMGTFETACMLAPYAKYMYGSQELEPGTGWNYTRLIRYLNNYPNANGADLGHVQASSYLTYCKGDDDITFSIIDLSAIGDVVSAVDKAAQELYEAGCENEVGRAARKTEHFGSNNRVEGYTNMIDLAGLMDSLSSLAPSAAEVRAAVDAAVIAKVSGSHHTDACGLSVYYPLSVRSGSKELSVVRDISPSAYYLALCTQVAYGTSDSFLAGLAAGFGSTEQETPVSGSCSDASCPLGVTSAAINEDGIYTVTLTNIDELAYASCIVYWEYYLDEEETQSWSFYLGEDDDALVDWENGTVQDNFDGSWLALGDQLIPAELIAQYDTESVYTCSVLLNGEETNLRIVYDWENGSFSVPGTFDGINAESGMAGRGEEPLKDGDVLEIVYWYLDENGEWDTVTGDPITVEGELSLSYGQLPAGDYSYAFNLYDVHGASWSTDFVLFGVQEDGSVVYYETES